MCVKGLLCRAEVGKEGTLGFLLASCSLLPKKLVSLDSVDGKMERVLPT